MTQNIWTKSFIGLAKAKPSFRFAVPLLQGMNYDLLHSQNTSRTVFCFLSAFRDQCTKHPASRVIELNAVRLRTPTASEATLWHLGAEILNLAPIQITIKAHLAYFQSLHKFSSSWVSPRNSGLHGELRRKFSFSLQLPTTHLTEKSRPRRENNSVSFAGKHHSVPGARIVGWAHLLHPSLNRSGPSADHCYKWWLFVNRAMYWCSISFGYFLSIS